MNNSGEGARFLRSLETWRGTKDFNLGQIEKVLTVLGDPQDKVRSIHVAGTNGKGSVSTIAAAIVAAAGYRTGLNTSPHLVDLSERVVIDGAPVEYDVLEQTALRLKAAIEVAGVTLSFHEGITALAFELFQDLDYAVFEVGLGGRLDSTNAIRQPEVSVITTIGRDHEHVLGSTPEEVAGEKAGIIKDGGKLVVGAIADGPLSVILSVAEAKGATVYRYGKDFHVENMSAEKGLVNRGKFFWKDEPGLEFEVALAGPHQLHNAALAFAAAKIIGIRNKFLQEGATRAYWPARCEELSGSGISRRVIVDCAHNPDGIKALKDMLQTGGIKRFDIAIGVLESKRWEEMLEILAPAIVKWSIVEPASERRLDSRVLAQKIQELSGDSGSEINIYDTDYTGFVDRECRGQSEVPLVITGSMYMIGEIYRQFPERRKSLW